MTLVLTLWGYLISFRRIEGQKSTIALQSTLEGRGDIIIPAISERRNLIM